MPGRSSALEHFHHPRNVGEIPEATVSIEAKNPVCSNLPRLWVVVRDGRIVEARFKVEGCIPAVACASWLRERMRGRSPAELAAVTLVEIEAVLDGLPAASRHASVLASDGLKRVLRALPE